MKKTVLNVLAILVATLCNTGCSGSSSDSGGGSNSQIEEILKQYAWYYNYSDASIWGDENVDLTTENFTLYFLDGGKGIGRFYSRSEDSYFGTSRNQEAFTFTYTVNGTTVKIMGSGYLIDTSYTYATEYMISVDGESIFSKSHEISSSDREWMASVKYEILPDEERLKFNYTHSCDEGSIVSSGSSKSIIVKLCLGVEASAKAYSRRVTSLRATYTITGGSFVGKKPTTEVSINADRDYSVGTIATISTTSKATVEATFTAYDAKNKKYVDIGSASYVVPQNNNTDNDNNDNNKEDNTGGNNQDETNVSNKGKNNGHEWVDLGLSVKWATMNIGASSPEGYGKYYAWGEIKNKSIYTWSTYKYCNGSSTTLTKYNTKNDKYGMVDTKTKLEPSDDAAQSNWGGTWRMPTNDEWFELETKCTWTWTVQNGINGYIITSKSNGSYIFLPAAGSRDDSSRSHLGERGYYWLDALYETYPYYALTFFFYQTNRNVTGGYRCKGQSIRAVCP